MSADSRQRPSKRPSVKGGSQARPAQGTRQTANQPPTQRVPRKRPSAQGAPQRRRTSQTASAARPRTQAKRSDGAHAARATAPKRTYGKRKTSLWEKVISSKPAMIALALIVVVAIAGIADTSMNWGKAYGNVSVMGVDVSGRTHDEIIQDLKMTFGPRISHAQTTIYASEQAREGDAQALSEEERREVAEQISAEDALASIDSWTADALSLKARADYEAAAEAALAVGRLEGGVIERAALLFQPHDVDLEVAFDGEAIDALAAEIDRTVGDARIDATVGFDEGEAHAVEGHDGAMIDRGWLAGRISDAMIRDDVPDWFVAQTSFAPSRITLEQARDMAESINRALAAGATFTYADESWSPAAVELSDWTRVVTEADEGGGWRLRALIDSEVALPAVVKGAGAAITADDMTVTFERKDEGIVVRTAGSGNVPEVSSAVRELDERLYGAQGTAFDPDAAAPVIDILETARPEELSFDQALELGVITVIGQYTTEFSNLEGTENRNHNIKLAADILDGGIVEANGGTWSFNDRTGDTNEEAGFWSAGSIVDGEFVDSIGGGICQVATTIFNAVYEAGLDVVERHNHSLYIASYPTGRDASVSYPDLEFTWKNDLESDVLLKLDYTDDSVSARLYSVYTGYQVTTETGEWQDGRKYQTRFELDESLGAGAYYLKTIGEDGSSITIVRTILDGDGALVGADSFGSTYDAKDEVYVIGPDVDTSKLVRKDEGSDVR